ncbi:MAG: hypothetical protein ACE5JX_18345, partial [Acidobacteriota bacterium]
AFYIVSERVASWRRMIPVTSERDFTGYRHNPVGVEGITTTGEPRVVANPGLDDASPSGLLVCSPSHPLDT